MKNVKMVRLTVFVREDEAHRVREGLDEFFWNHDGLLWGSPAQVGDMDPDHPEGYDITRFLYQMELEEENDHA